MPVIHIVIPALNEAENIGRLFVDLAAVQVALADEFDTRVVLVDDGSGDGTGDRARDAAGGLSLTVLRHEQPAGPGRAFASGFAAVAPMLEPDDFVLTLEADNTSRLDVLRVMLQRVAEGHDVVLASPYIYGGGIVGAGRLRTLLSHIANSYIKAMLDIRGILTVSSFYRLYRGDSIERLQCHYGAGIVESSGFECMVELVLKMMYLEMSISEVPMVLESDRRIGPSKMRITRAARGYIRLFTHRRRWRDQAAVEGVWPVGRDLELDLDVRRRSASIGR